jgi:hypothetical protein
VNLPATCIASKSSGNVKAFSARRVACISYSF